jgi:Glycine cleavage system P-protein
MLSKSYKDLLKVSQKQHLLRALFTSPASTPAVSGSTQAMSFGTQARPASTLQKNIQLNISRTILNKQLHYLHSSKIASSLKPSDDFTPRHLGNDAKSTQEILKRLGVSSIEELMDQTVPPSIRLPKDQVFKHNGKEIKGITSETMMLAHLRDLANANKVNRSFQGCGFYPT